MAYVEASVRHGHLVGAARSAFARNGVWRTSLRAVAAEAGVPLGTMQHVFASKEHLLRAVIEDVVTEIAGVLDSSATLDAGLARAVRDVLTGYWTQLVDQQNDEQIMQYELTTYALRTSGQHELARWQYSQYCDVVAQWCRRAAEHAGEVCAVPYTQLARVIVAGMDGLILQHICDADADRSASDLDALIDMVTALADVRPTPAKQ